MTISQPWRENTRCAASVPVQLRCPSSLRHLESVPRCGRGAGCSRCFFSPWLKYVRRPVRPGAKSARSPPRPPGRTSATANPFSCASSKPFVDRQLGHRLHHLIDFLAHLAVTVDAQVSDHPADLLEHRQTALVGLILPPTKSVRLPLVAPMSAPLSGASRFQCRARAMPRKLGSPTAARCC